MKYRLIFPVFGIFTLIGNLTVFASGTVKGFVKDRANGETISYANIIIANTNLGDASDENGYYVIPGAPEGQILVKAMMMGYKSQEKQVTIIHNKTITLDFYLESSPIQMETIIKTAERERFERQIEPSTIHITPREIRSVPAFIEADLFRSLQMLPGVVAQTDFSTALYIRGGNPSENIILLDDVRIYNPYHLGGVFSTFNTDAIKSVDFSMGGFPPRYGNAISSVISITNKDGNSKEFESRGSISLLSSKITLEHPIPNGSILVTGRRTYFDYIYNTFIRPKVNDDFRFPYYFYDFHGKINYEFTPNNKITLSGFYGDDILHIEEERERWDERGSKYVAGKDVTEIRFGNASTTLKWRYIFNPKLFSESIIATSRFRANLETTAFEINDNVDAKDEIHDLTLKTDLTYFLSDNHEIKFGLDYQRLSFTLYFRVAQFEWIAYRGDKTRRANFFSTYLQDDWKLSPLLNIQTGIRFTSYDLGNFFRADPRLGIRYRWQHNVNLKASFGIFHQYFYTFNPEDFDYIRMVDLWFPIDNRYSPIRAIHYNFGLEHWLSDNYTFSIEAYYKDYANVLDLNEFGRQDVEIDDFLKGWGQAGGMELLFRKQRGRFTGWLGYSLALTQRTIESPRPSNQLANKTYETEYQTFFPNHDRRHTLTLVAGYQAGEKWKLGSRFTYASGLPETPTIGWKMIYDVDEAGIYGSSYPIKADKNSKRLPPYLRLDLSLSRNFKFKNWALQPFLDIINVTNHHNIFFYNYDLNPEYDPYGNIITTKPRRQGVAMFPVLPTIGVNFEF